MVEMVFEAFHLWFFVCLNFPRYTDQSYLPVTTINGGKNHVLFQNIETYPGNAVRFQVKGCEDARFLVSSQAETALPPYVLVVLGTLGNTVSYLERRVNVDVVVDSLESAELDCNAYKDFWIKVEQGLIQIGRGDIIGTDIILSHVEECRFRFRSVELSTESNTGIDWRFYNPTSVTGTLTPSQDLIQRYFRMSNDCPVFEVLKMQGMQTRIACGHKCMTEQGCNGYWYYNETKICEMVSDIATADTVNMYYILRIIH